ncbi:MAG: DUF6148 family protein [Fusobacteriaceae bacterium]
MYSKEQCEKHLEIWLEAEIAIASAQEYEHMGKKLKKADLRYVLQMQEVWEKRLERAKGISGGGFITGYPR